MKLSSNFFIALVALFLLSTGMIFSEYVEQEPWVVPAKYKKMENPTDPKDSEGLMIGKQLYIKHCKSCHGKTGLGDGPKAAELKTPSGDFSDAKFQSQTDGELYYKSIIGRDEMPSYEKKIPEEEDRWLIVNFMRTLAK